MFRTIAAALLALGLAAPAFAQTAAVTATCKDGTSYSGTSHRGACSHHGGVASFGQPAATGATPTGATAAAGPNVSCPGDKVVWVNTHSGVYHFRGERDFGNTKSGKYLCEKAADAEGDRPTRNGQ